MNVAIFSSDFTPWRWLALHRHWHLTATEQELLVPGAADKHSAPTMHM